MIQHSASVSTTNISACQRYLDEILLGKDICLSGTLDNHAHLTKIRDHSCVMHVFGMYHFQAR